MTIQALTTLFGWMTVINGGLFLFTALMIMLVPNLAYKIQSKFIAIERDYFDKVIYAFLGAWKLFLAFFNLVPYIALVIMQSG